VLAGMMCGMGKLPIPTGLAAQIALLLVLVSPSAQAGPPFVTDDPEPVEYHHWEVYIASVYAHTRDGTSGTGPHVEVNYGVVPNVQLHLITPFVYDHPAHGGTPYGYGDTELGVKFRFVQETRSRPQVGIFPLLEVPTGSSSRGLGSGHPQMFLPIWLQKSWGPWTTYGGGGYWRHPGAGNRDWWLTGWEIQCALSRSLTLGAELFHTTPDTAAGESGTSFNIGGFLNFDEGHHLLFSAGRGLHGPNLFSAYLAYQWTFGPREATDETIPQARALRRPLILEVARMMSR
jgi:hypothetical protein